MLHNKRWKPVRKRIAKTDELRLKHRVLNFKVDSLGRDVAAQAKDILDKHCLDNVRCASAGAAAFFQWVIIIESYIHFYPFHLLICGQ